MCWERQLLDDGETGAGFDDSDEAPAHAVHVESFSLGKYEVMEFQFAAFIAETGYDAGRLRHYANYGDRVAEPASRKPNQWGLHDVRGNVWE